jgi:recombination protein RecA
MFSMAAMSSVLDRAELARLGVLQGTEAFLPSRSVLGLGWPELECTLPDRGLPRGVVELAALPSLSSGRMRSSDKSAWRSSGTTSIAIAAIGAIHSTDAHSWCAWVTPRGDAPGDARAPSLYAPALAQANVDLERLLVVRPSVQALARTAVKVAMSGAFELVIIDAPHPRDLCGGAGFHTGVSRPAFGLGGKDGGALAVRKLALAAEEYGTTSLLLTNAQAPRSVPWPVALRLEVERRPDALALRVTKDRRGCGSSQHVVRLAG